MKPMQDHMKTVLLFSGGIDSLAAWFYLRKPDIMYIDMQSRYTFKERHAIDRLHGVCPDLSPQIISGINLGQFESGLNAYIPNRNLILASIAAIYGDIIVIAGIKDDHVGDKSPKAFGYFSKVLTLISGTNKEVVSPFWNFTKTKIIKWMLDYVPYAESLINESSSCYSVTSNQCGNCPACLRKAIAMSNNNLSLKVFTTDVTKSPLISIYIDKMKDPSSNYNIERVTDTLKAFSKWGYEI